MGTYKLNEPYTLNRYLILSLSSFAGIGLAMLFITGFDVQFMLFFSMLLIPICFLMIPFITAPGLWIRKFMGYEFNGEIIITKNSLKYKKGDKVTTYNLNKIESIDFMILKPGLRTPRMYIYPEVSIKFSDGAFKFCTQKDDYFMVTNDLLSQLKAQGKRLAKTSKLHLGKFSYAVK
jgi:hypothetical protein